jgi:hypothetical protein
MAADWGTPYPLRCTNRPPGRPAACERADRLTLGDSTPRGPRRQLGGGLPRLSPDKREGGLPGTGRGVSESAGRGAAKEKGEGQKDPRGRELPAGIPEAQPAAPGLMGGWWSPKGHSHGGHGLSVAARSGRLDQPRCGPTSQDQPRRSQAVLGHTCQPRPKGGKGRDKCWVCVRRC